MRERRAADPPIRRETARPARPLFALDMTGSQNAGADEGSAANEGDNEIVYYFAYVRTRGSAGARDLDGYFLTTTARPESGRIVQNSEKCVNTLVLNIMQRRGRRGMREMRATTPPGGARVLSGAEDSVEGP